MNILLFALCALIWGSTWFFIKLQIATTSPLISVLYRFVISVILLFLICHLFKRPLKFDSKTHRFLFLQGIFNFSLNYILTYKAETLAPSAIVALSFTSLVYFNTFGLYFFFKKPVGKQVLVGGLLGGIGIYLLFYKDFVGLDSSHQPLIALGIGLLASVCASIGNMISHHLHERKIPVLSFNFWGMLYGSICTLVVCLVDGEKFSIEMTPQFIYSTLYLAIIGTVVAFGFYFHLLGRIGAAKASFTSIVSPAIAVLVSGVFENFQLTSLVMMGVTLILIGNAVTLATRPMKR